MPPVCVPDGRIRECAECHTILAAIAAYLALPVRDARVTILVLTLVGLVVLSLIRREHMGEGFMRAVRRIPWKKHDSRRR